MRAAAALVMLAVCAAPAQAAVVSARPDKVAVVIYNINGQGLAMVSETRTIALAAGVQDIQFRNVSANLVPQTAQLDGIAGIGERNFDFNLLSPGALLQRAIGQQVRLVRRDPATGRVREESAMVRSGPDGVVLEKASGTEALSCSGLNESIVFDRIPDNLFDVPTLSVKAHVAAPGRHVVTLRYLATGLSWRANYVARAGTDRMDLSGWITLTNNSETGFGDAPVEVVAGQINLTGEDRPIPAFVTGRSSQCWPTDINWSSALGDFEKVTVSASRINLMGFPAPTPAAPPPAAMSAANRDAVVRDLGDLKLYALAEPTTVAAHQTKQVRFLDRRDIPFARVHRVIFQGFEVINPGTAERPSVPILRFTNDKASGLGAPLPAGRVAITRDQQGTPVLSGEPPIRDTPIDLPLELEERQTLTVSARVRTLFAPPIARGQTNRRGYEVTITNRRNSASAFEWAQAPFIGMAVTGENRPHGRRDGRLVWSVPLKPGETIRLTYAVSWPG